MSDFVKLGQEILYLFLAEKMVVCFVCSVYILFCFVLLQLCPILLQLCPILDYFLKKLKHSSS